MRKEFLLSDESVNSHNTIVRTDGINIDRFLKNPVMYYNHDEGKGVVGRWENLRKAEGKLYGTPVFSVDNEVGRMLQRQVESGFIRGASIGIDNIEYEYNPAKGGTPKVIAGCELIEVSVCDIPSNRNTLQLYYNNKAVDPDAHLDLIGVQKSAGMRMIREELGLPEDASLSVILKTITTLRGEQSGDRLALAVRRGWMTTEEAEGATETLGHSPGQLEAFIRAKENIFNNGFEERFRALINRNRGKFKRSSLSGIQDEEIRALAKSNFSAFAKLLDSMLDRRLVIDDIRPEGELSEDRSGWTLEDYRKKAPMELKRNPALFQRLVEQKKNS